MKASRRDLSRHPVGIAAVTESHFVYEESQLVTVLETLCLDVDSIRVLRQL